LDKRILEESQKVKQGKKWKRETEGNKDTNKRTKGKNIHQKD
jgi:hypothetical protein